MTTTATKTHHFAHSAAALQARVAHVEAQLRKLDNEKPVGSGEPAVPTIARTLPDRLGGPAVTLIGLTLPAVVVDGSLVASVIAAALGAGMVAILELAEVEAAVAVTEGVQAAKRPRLQTLVLGAAVIGALAGCIPLAARSAAGLPVPVLACCLSAAFGAVLGGSVVGTVVSRWRAHAEARESTQAERERRATERDRRATLEADLAGLNAELVRVEATGKAPFAIWLADREAEESEPSAASASEVEDRNETH